MKKEELFGERPKYTNEAQEFLKPAVGRKKVCVFTSRILSVHYSYLNSYS